MYSAKNTLLMLSVVTSVLSMFPNVEQLKITPEATINIQNSLFSNNSPEEFL